MVIEGGGGNFKIKTATKKEGWNLRGKCMKANGRRL